MAVNGWRDYNEFTEQMALYDDLFFFQNKICPSVTVPYLTCEIFMVVVFKGSLIGWIIFM